MPSFFDKDITKILQPSALHRSVWSIYGKSGFTNKGSIKVEVLKELAGNGKRFPLAAHRARLALNFYNKNGVHKRRKRRR